MPHDKEPSTPARACSRAFLILVSPGFSSYAAAAQLGAARHRLREPPWDRPAPSSRGPARFLPCRPPVLDPPHPLLTSGLAPAPALFGRGRRRMSLSATIGAVPSSFPPKPSPRKPSRPPPPKPDPSIGALREAVSAETPAAPTGWSIGRLFDGLGRRGSSASLGRSRRRTRRSGVQPAARLHQEERSGRIVGRRPAPGALQVPRLLAPRQGRPGRRLDAGNARHRHGRRSRRRHGPPRRSSCSPSRRHRPGRRHRRHLRTHRRPPQGRRFAQRRELLPPCCATASWPAPASFVLLT